MADDGEKGESIYTFSAWVRAMLLHQLPAAPSHATCRYTSVIRQATTNFKSSPHAAPCGITSIS